MKRSEAIALTEAALEVVGVSGINWKTREDIVFTDATSYLVRMLGAAAEIAEKLEEWHKTEQDEEMAWDSSGLAQIGKLAKDAQMKAAKWGQELSGVPVSEWMKLGPVFKKMIG